MNIDELTIGQVKAINALGINATPEKVFVIGESVLIRTVTMFWIGTVVKETDRFVYLSPAAWVADTGRFADCLAKGELSEVEPVTTGHVERIAIGAIVDVSVWSHAVPTAQK